MTEPVKRFSERLASLLLEHDSPVELHSVVAADGQDDGIEVHARCPADPVLQPPAGVERTADTTGPWDRRRVRLVVRVPADDSYPLSAELTYATGEADDAGDRSVTFGWEFGDDGTTGLAEMKFNDSRTFKLDYFSVLPPRYVSDFAALCQSVFNDTCRD